MASATESGTVSRRPGEHIVQAMRSILQDPRVMTDLEAVGMAEDNIGSKLLNSMSAHERALIRIITRMFIRPSEMTSESQASLPNGSESSNGGASRKRRRTHSNSSATDGTTYRGRSRDTGRASPSSRTSSTSSSPGANSSRSGGNAAVAKPFRCFFRIVQIALHPDLVHLLQLTPKKAAVQLLFGRTEIGELVTARDHTQESDAFCRLYKFTENIEKRQVRDHARWLVVMLVMRAVVSLVNPDGSARVGAQIAKTLSREYLTADMLTSLNVTTEEAQTRIGTWSVNGDHIAEFTSILGKGCVLWLSRELSPNFVAKKCKTNRRSREQAMNHLESLVEKNIAEVEMANKIVDCAVELILRPFRAAQEAAQAAL